MSDAATICSGSVGIRIEIDFHDDINSADSLILRVQLPDFSVVEWEAIPVQDMPSHGVYVTQEGDLEQVGTYTVEPWVMYDSPVKKLPCTKFSFLVCRSV